MSRTILNAILNEMQIWLNENKREQLYRELRVSFGLIGATDQCQNHRKHINGLKNMEDTYVNK
jgi:hypothetical protein